VIKNNSLKNQGVIKNVPFIQDVELIYQDFLYRVSPQFISESPNPDQSPISNKTPEIQNSRYLKAEIWAREQNQNPPLCKCGCGRSIIITYRHKYRGIPDYIPYHQPSFKKRKDTGVDQ
jgi:hypothetical protein